MSNPVLLLRTVGLVEAVSLLLLFGVAMPLKYVAGRPGAVTVIGWAHGVLFMAFCAMLLVTMVRARWPLGRGVLLFVAAWVPLGPFLVDGRLKRWAAEYEAARA